MVSITAKITVAEISAELGIFDNLSKVLVQRMFNMNFFRPFFDNYDFFIQPVEATARALYAGEDKVTIGLWPGETDGSKAAVLAYIVKSAPSHINLEGFSKKAPVTPDPETP